MKTWIALLLLAFPAPALAHGLSLEIGTVFAAPQESALRAVEDQGKGFFGVGLSGNLTVVTAGTFRVDALIGWSVTQTESFVAKSITTSFLEHSVAAGARLRWARFWFAQPYVSVRGGAAFGWLDLRPENSGRLEAWDYAFRVEPALGFEAFLPFFALGGHFPHPDDPVERGGGSSRPGIGLGLEVGYRFQSPLRFSGEHPEPEDEDLAADELERTGPDMGDLTISGIRAGLNLFARF